MKGILKSIEIAGIAMMFLAPFVLAELADLAEGDIVEFEYLGRGALRIAKKTED